MSTEELLLAILNELRAQREDSRHLIAETIKRFEECRTHESDIRENDKIHNELAEVRLRQAKREESRQVKLDAFLSGSPAEKPNAA